MRVMYDGELHVHYSQFYVSSGDAGESAGAGDTRVGQANGLCGAAVPGFLFLTTGLHTGLVPLRLERHDTEPPVPEDWEDIVEVSFTSVEPQVRLLLWEGDSFPLDLEPTTYRVRYCANGMDEGHDIDGRAEGEPVADRYLMQWWPGPFQADRIVKQTSQSAGYWNSGV
ncbi:MAG: hypothetical protein ACRD0P_10610 [Stackebrandtia sp.]